MSYLPAPLLSRWLRTGSCLTVDAPIIIRLNSRVGCLGPQRALCLRPRQRRRLYTTKALSPSPPLTSPPPLSAAKLPPLCSGCGAFSQTRTPGVAGYYDVNRRTVRESLQREPVPTSRRSRDARGDLIVANALKSLDEDTLSGLDLSAEDLLIANTVEPSLDHSQASAPALCDRCHALTHHGEATSIFHPSLDVLVDTVHESPHKVNHIYHLVDAADFPMSIIPGLDDALDIRLKSRNRRSKAGTYLDGRKFTISFIVTRVDLIIDREPQIPSVAAIFDPQLRAAFGRVSRHAILGKIYYVSAKRGWNTSKLRTDIQERGGASWMIGKANVGKSQLLRSIFPKGLVTSKQADTREFSQADSAGSPAAGEEVDDSNSVMTDMAEGRHATAPIIVKPVDHEEPEEIPELWDLDSLLPPPMPLTDYPDMPIVSALPGTTASPIRIPFGKRKGEMIDMPGLLRSELEQYVKPEHRASLVMTERVMPEQLSIKLGQSLVLGGGLIRITPRTDGLVFLAHNFTNLHAHVTRTDKATGLQAQNFPSAVQSIAVPEVATNAKLALIAALRTNVTRSRCLPLFRNGVFKRASKLPFAVLASDILLEGTGWIELTAQIRTRHRPQAGVGQATDSRHASNKTGRAPQPLSTKAVVGEADDADYWPTVNVFTPDGRFVRSRESVDGSVLGKRRILPKHRKKRPRRSMKGHKKQMKVRKRAALLAATAAPQSPSV